jgi:acetyl esterase/lipase
VEAAEAAYVAAQFGALDRDGDGRATRAELPPALAALLPVADTSGDDALDLAEYTAFHGDPGGARHTPTPANVEVVEGIAYAGTDHPRQRLDLWLPKRRSGDGPLPVIAYVHGGAWNMGSRVMARPQVASLVASGDYAAVAIGYRLSWQATWPAQLHDLKAALRWVRAHAARHGLDSDRICAMGASAGGHLVAALGTSRGVAELEGTLGTHAGERSDVQCVVDFFGPSDLEAPPPASRAQVAGDGPSSREQLLGAPPAEVPALARQASPLRHVAPGAPPFLIVHGTRDPLVALDQSTQLAAALTAAGVENYLVVVEGGGHGDFLGPAVAERVRTFLDHVMRGAPERPSVEPIVHAPGG